MFSYDVDVTLQFLLNSCQSFQFTQIIFNIKFYLIANLFYCFPYMISRLLSLLLVVCSCSDEPDPEPTSINSSFWSCSESCSWLALASCHAGIDGGTTGLLEDTAGNCFLNKRTLRQNNRNKQKNGWLDYLLSSKPFTLEISDLSSRNCLTLPPFSLNLSTSTLTSSRLSFSSFTAVFTDFSKSFIVSSTVFFFLIPNKYGFMNFWKRKQKIFSLKFDKNQILTNCVWYFNTDYFFAWNHNVVVIVISED